MDKVFSHAVAHVSEAAHVWRGFWFLEKSQAWRVKALHERNQKNVTAGRGATGNPRFAKECVR